MSENKLVKALAFPFLAIKQLCEASPWPRRTCRRCFPPEPITPEEEARLDSRINELRKHYAKKQQGWIVRNGTVERCELGDITYQWAKKK